MVVVYVATNKLNNKKYIGVSEHFERRLTEHMRSKYPFGNAMRKYGTIGFHYELIECDTVELAYELEGLMVGPEEVKDPMYYNACVGGIFNPAFKSKVSGDSHWTKDAVSIHNKRSVIQIQNALTEDPLVSNNQGGAGRHRKVVIKGIIYEGVRAAARCLKISRQCLVHRLKSNNFPDYSYHFG